MNKYNFEQLLQTVVETKQSTKNKYPATKELLLKRDREDLVDTVLALMTILVETTDEKVIQ